MEELSKEKDPKWLMENHSILYKKVRKRHPTGTAYQGRWANTAAKPGISDFHH